MSGAVTVDVARLPLLLGELRLPTVAALWPQFTERADREGGEADLDRQRRQAGDRKAEDEPGERQSRQQEARQVDRTRRPRGLSGR